MSEQEVEFAFKNMEASIKDQLTSVEFISRPFEYESYKCAMKCTSDFKAPHDQVRDCVANCMNKMQEIQKRMQHPQRSENFEILNFWRNFDVE